MNCNKNNRWYHIDPGEIGQQKYFLKVILVTNVLDAICCLYTITVNHEETTLIEFGMCDMTLP